MITSGKTLYLEPTENSKIVRDILLTRRRKGRRVCARPEGGPGKRGGTIPIKAIGRFRDHERGRGKTKSLDHRGGKKQGRDFAPEAVE